eukprot:NODE_2031_length_1011_cov_169.186192.p1 GENE.NODE_2031_length_1011_cov_169.186192~~NODE_2031_length_1011_cov_169.186192.p1  ORF type:complete len:305 (-),score=103.56 NODE_2031_length_1011_cov_169.186192:63-935(-)
MVQALEEEQVSDDKKKADCNQEFDRADDEKKHLERDLSDLASVMDEAKQSLQSTEDDIKALEKGIASLDKSVAEATKARQEEHAEFTDLMASNTAAKELIHMAKNRMNQFYNKKLYKAPEKKELSAEGRIYENQMGFIQLSRRAFPAAAPQAPTGAYTKQAEGSNGVIAMMDLLVAELDKEMTEAKTDEENAQAEYEQMLRDSKDKRAQDSTSLGEKQSTKAALEGKLQEHGDSNRALNGDLKATLAHIEALHSDCDWLMQNYDTRKAARANERDALHQAKAVLTGADYA